jgi:hypothetical protein
VGCGTDPVASPPPPHVPKLFSLNIAGANGSAGATCLMLSLGRWESVATTFGVSTAPADPRCVLAPGFIAGRTSYWVAGVHYEVALEGIPSSEGDDVRHTLRSADDEVAEGHYVMRVYPLDHLDDAAELLWEGHLSVNTYDEAGGRVAITLE